MAILPEKRLGIALKIIDGGTRASEAAITALLMRCGVLDAGHPVVESALSTGSGDITVFIPSNVAVTVHAQNSGPGGVGSIVSDFTGIRLRALGAAVMADGDVNGGGPLLTLAGSGGRIFIKRK